MRESSRRRFMTYAGVAAAGVVAAGPVAAGSRDGTRHENAKHHVDAPDVVLPEHADGSLVAYVHDVHTGEMSVMVEGREVTVTDHDLVARLARALHSASFTSD